MFDWGVINYADKLIGLILAISQALMIAFITGIVLNRAFQKEKAIGKSLKEYGIERVKTNKGTLSAQDCHVVFGLGGHAVPRELCLCFITGNAFFRDYERNAGYLASLAARGCRIRILLANPNQAKAAQLWDEQITSADVPDEVVEYYFRLLKGLYKTTSFIERTFLMLTYRMVENCIDDEESCKALLRRRLRETKDHVMHVRTAQQLLSAAAHKSDHGGSIELRYYIDEYQMPIIMAKTDATEKKPARTLVWTNMNAPIQETSDSINVFAVKNEGTAGFVEDVEKSFEYLWRTYPQDAIAAPDFKSPPLAYCQA